MRPDTLPDLLRRTAAESESPRSEALRALAEHIDTAPLRGSARRLREPGIVGEVTSLRSLAQGYGHDGPGGEESFVEAATNLVRSEGVERWAARPLWAPLSWITWVIVLFREQRVPCPDCGERIPRHARVCRYCGYRLDVL